MPLEVLRLRRSKAWLICKRRPELAFYLINLWTAAWHERPAGSLEHDDDVLADLAMCPPKDWTKVRKDVLRGWVKCSDGRIYHPVVVEKVRDAWRSKMTHAYDRECGRLRKAAERAGNKKSFVPPTFEQWDKGRVSTGNEWTSSGQHDLSNGQDTDVQRTSIECPPENALKGREGRGKGREIKGYVSGHTLSAGRPADMVPELSDAESHERFEVLKADYPEISGSHDWQTAEHHARLIVERGLATWDYLQDRVRRFRAWVRAGGVSAPQFVMGPVTYFTRRDKPWSQEWDPPATKAQLKQDANIDAARVWLAQSEGK